jgi:nitrite reductase/ring-hydroxylating ferredoxin subunit
VTGASSADLAAPAAPPADDGAPAARPEASHYRVVELDRRDANGVEVGEELYLFLDPHAPELVPTRCPHRGGPLHLATLADSRKGMLLICPWHQSAVPMRALQRRAVATVQSGTKVRAVFELPVSARAVVRQVPVHFDHTPPCAASCAAPSTEGSQS